MKPTPLILCGDIGGTKALLGLARNAEGKPHLVFCQRYACADFNNFSDLFIRFHADAAGHASQVTAGCLAVAGPVGDDGLTAKITNLPWTVDARTCAAVFNLPRLQLVNDFAAAAAGIATLESAGLHTLRRGTVIPEAPRLIVGAGTGLGMAALLPAQDSWRVLPGEGGHVGFSPWDETSTRIHAALLAEHGRATWERVVSGPGLATIHRLLAHEAATPETLAQRALAGDKTALASLHFFLAAYGAYAGDMALALMARGGVFLAGGIAAKILPLMAGSPFLDSFDAKAEHAALAANMPVHVVTDARIGIQGAALLAAT